MSAPRDLHRTQLRKTLIQVGLLMAGVEVAIMLILDHLDLRIDGWRMALVDSFILTTVVGFFGYYALVRPRDRRLRTTMQALSEARREAQRLARIDALTNLLGRRALFDELRREWQRSERHSHDLAVVMVDLDDFKAINDEYGHQAGDAVIRVAAEVLGHQCRTIDHAGRYGGEEFLVVAPDTQLEGAEVLAERIRAAIEGADIDSEHGPRRITASIGVASRAGHESVAELVRAADRALLEAKQAGKNQVVVGRPELVASSS